MTPGAEVGGELAARERPTPLVEVRRRAGYSGTPWSTSSTILDVPVPQVGNQLVASPEQVIAVPRISSSSRCFRTVLSAPQTAEQLVEVPPDVVARFRLLEPIADIPALRGPFQSVRMALTAAAHHSFDKVAADETYRGLRAQKTARAGGARLGVLKQPEPQEAVQKCIVEQSPSEPACAPQLGDDVGLQRGEAEFIEMLVMSSCLALRLPEPDDALRLGRASASSCPAPHGAPRLAGESLRGGDSNVQWLVLSSSSHSAPLAGVSCAVEDDMEEEDEEEESEEDEEKEVLFSQHSQLDIFRGEK